jgi:ABC-2 type transport system permease protein
MLTILRYSLAKSRGQILGWGLSLAILGGYLVSFYDTIADQREALLEMLKAYPPELFAIFGDMTDMFKPSGYLNVEFFSYMPLILGIFTLLAGSGLLAGDEESGILDLLMAHPVSRASLFWGRVASFTLATMGILVITWLGFLAFAPGTSMDISPGEMLLPFLSLFATLMLIGALAILLSLVLPSRRLAAMVTGLVLVASFFITALERLDESLKPVADLSPITYYQGGLAIDGMEWGWFVGTLALTVLFTLLAWWRFERRDIRVGGEGSWGIPRISFRKRNSIEKLHHET